MDGAAVGEGDGEREQGWQFVTESDFLVASETEAGADGVSGDLMRSEPGGKLMEQ